MEYEAPNNVGWYWKTLNKLKNQFKEGYDGDKWKHTKDEKYTTGSGYRWLIGSPSKWRYASVAWNRFSVPKHEFISWVTLHERLFTKPRMMQIGIPVEDMRCWLCLDENESVRHLFFEYSQTKELLRKACEWLGAGMVSTSWTAWRRWVRFRFSKTPCKWKAITAMVVAMVYHAWRERNSQMHGGEMSTAEMVWSKVKMELLT